MHRNQHPSLATTRHAFTLIELIVVFSIIVTLISAVLVAGPALIDRAKTTSTQAILVQVQAMVELFEREQRERPTIARPRRGEPTYIKRYGFFPPDELEIFTPSGVPNTPTKARRSLAPGQAELIPAPTGSNKYSSMKFYLDRNDKLELEHRDNAALVLAIELYGRESKALLDSISATHRVTAPVDDDGNPLLFLDRDRNQKWTPEKDLPIRYIVDSWKLPISYLAQRDWVKSSSSAVVTKSGNSGDWNQASTQMIRRNNSQPIIFSYGANGSDQLTKDIMTSDITGEVTLIQDWMGGGSLGTKQQIDHPLNVDNVYANPQLKDRLAKPPPNPNDKNPTS